MKYKRTIKVRRDDGTESERVVELPAHFLGEPSESGRVFVRLNVDLSVDEVRFHWPDEERSEITMVRDELGDLASDGVLATDYWGLARVRPVSEKEFRLGLEGAGSLFSSMMARSGVEVSYDAEFDDEC